MKSKRHSVLVFPRLGELLSSIKAYPYMYRGIANDIDQTLGHGYYVATENSINMPPNAYKYGVLEVFGGDSFLAQRYTPHANYSGNYGEYNRVRYKETWSSWRFIPYQL